MQFWCETKKISFRQFHTFWMMFHNWLNSFAFLSTRIYFVIWLFRTLSRCRYLTKKLIFSELENLRKIKQTWRWFIMNVRTKLLVYFQKNLIWFCPSNVILFFQPSIFYCKTSNLATSFRAIRGQNSFK